MKRSLVAGFGIAAALILWSSGSAFSAPLSAKQAEQGIKACAHDRIAALRATPLPVGKSAKVFHQRIRAAVQSVRGLVRTAENTIERATEPLEDQPTAAAPLDFSSLKTRTCADIAKVTVNLKDLPGAKAGHKGKGKGHKKDKKHEKEHEDAGERAGHERGEAGEVER